MRRLIESTLTTIDSVVESPARWAIFDAAATELTMRPLDECDAFVWETSTPPLGI